MAIFYMSVGILAGLWGSVWVGVASGSILLALLAWSLIGTCAVFLAAGIVYLRQSRQACRTDVRLIAAE